MNRRFPKSFLSMIGVALLAAGLTLSCGGGGGGGGNDGGGTTPPGLTATFTASNASPGTNTLRMNSGAASGDTFEVLIEVTDVTDFFGAGFRVNYDPASATFLGFSSSGSFLLGQGAATDFDAVEQSAGDVAVNATLQALVQGLTATGNQLLITLNFRATAATGGNAFSFGAPRTMETCPAPPGICSSTHNPVVTWSGGTLTAN